MQQIGDRYFPFGSLLLNDENGAVTRAISKEYKNEAESINTEILTRWLQGQGKKPVTWSTLIKVLNDIELLQLAKTIEEQYKCGMKNQIQALTKEKVELQQQLDMKERTISQLQQEVRAE